MFALHQVVSNITDSPWIVLTVEQADQTFKSISQLIPVDQGAESSTRPRTNLVLDERKVADLHKTMKQLQHMIVFVKEALPEAENRHQFVPRNREGSGQEHFPITLTGGGQDAGGNPVSYSAQVIMYPFQPNDTRQRTYREDRVLNRKAADLTVLRQSPFFSSVLLERRRPTKKVSFSTRPGERIEEDELFMVSEEEARRSVQMLLDSVRNSGVRTVRPRRVLIVSFSGSEVKERR